MKKKLLLVLPWLCLAMSVNAQREITIDELYDLIEKNNSHLRAGRAGVEAARHGVESAKAERLPNVNIELQGSLNGDVTIMDRNFSGGESFPSPRCGNNFLVEAQQAIYTGGAISSGIKLAELGLQMEETNLTAARNNIRFASLAQYLELIKLDHASRVYDENIRLTHRLIENIGALQQQGMALRNDLTRYELQLQNLQLGKRKVEDARNIINHQLCVALGIEDVQILPDMSVASTTYTQDGLPHWHQQAQTASPELTRAKISMQMAEQQLKLAQSDNKPKIALVAADNLWGPFTYDLPPVDKNLNIWYVGLGVRYSPSSLWKAYKKVKYAKAELIRSQENKNVASEIMDTRMQEAYTLYMQSYAELETQQKSVELATQNYDMVLNRYNNQLALVTDMIDASNIKLSTELREVDARVNIAFAYYKLLFVAGKL